MKFALLVLISLLVSHPVASARVKGDVRKLKNDKTGKRDEKKNPSAAALVAASDFPSDMPSSMPSDAPSSMPSDAPSSMPSDAPSSMPSDVPSSMPSDMPSVNPNIPVSVEFPPRIGRGKDKSKKDDKKKEEEFELTSAGPVNGVGEAQGSDAPSDVPSFLPSATPSDAPSFVPSTTLSESTSDFPSDAPSSIPSLSPSEAPSDVPSTSPSSVASGSPSDAPSVSPSVQPSYTPSDVPSTSPSSILSESPSSTPSSSPSAFPSYPPSGVPSASPSPVPSAAPSTSSTVVVRENAISDSPSMSPSVVVTTTNPSPPDFATPTGFITCDSSEIDSEEDSMNVQVTFLYSLKVASQSVSESVRDAVEFMIQGAVLDKTCSTAPSRSIMHAVSAQPEDIQTASCGSLCAIMLGRLTLLLSSQSFDESKEIYCEAKAAVEELFDAKAFDDIEGLESYGILNRSQGSLCLDFNPDRRKLRGTSGATFESLVRAIKQEQNEMTALP